MSDFIDESGNSLTWQDNMFTGGQEKYPQFSAGQTIELKSGHQLKIKLLLSEKDDETGTFSIVRIKLFFKNDVDEIKGKIGLDIMDSRIQKGQTYYMREKYKELVHFEEFHVFASS